jgi:hypothetical protein
MWRAVGAAVLAASLAGCVDRFVSLRSEPPGAVVYLDGEKVGETPCEVKYIWYGTRELVIERKGYKVVREMISLRLPWWQFFPMDFITDVLVPFTLTDRTEFSYSLERDLPTEEERAEVLRRAAELREKAESPK